MVSNKKLLINLDLLKNILQKYTKNIKIHKVGKIFRESYYIDLKFKIKKLNYHLLLYSNGQLEIHEVKSKCIYNFSINNISKKLEAIIKHPDL
jgi:hypothetical protein